MSNTFKDARVLVVGGAGFVGSNLVHKILEQDPAQIIVVDNLLSSDVANIPADLRVKFVFGSITEDKILHALPEDLDYAFHLACFHGNQSSIADPMADHDNNTLTSLKLFDRLKDIRSLKKSFMQQPLAQSLKRLTTPLRQPPKTNPSRCTTTVPTRSPRSSASFTATISSSASSSHLSRRAFPTSTVLAKSSVPASGVEPSIPYGVTLRRPLYGAH